MRIRPGMRVCIEGPGTVRVGTGPGSLFLTGLGPAQLEAVGRLARGEPLGLPPREGKAVADRARLLAALAPVLTDTDPVELVHGMAAERLRPDGHAWAGTSPALDQHFLQRRSLAHVWVGDLDRCGMLVALGLAAAGVGRLSSCDEQPVGQVDLGSSPLRLTELGLPRSAALGRHVGRLYPQTHLLAPVPLPRTGGVDAVVVVARDGLEAGLAAELALADPPVLPVIFHESGFRIGPLSRAGGDACPVCVAADWPVLHGVDEARRSRQECGPETGSAMTAAGLAVQALLPLLDGVHSPAVSRGAFEGSLADGATRFVPLPTACAHRQAA